MKLSIIASVADERAIGIKGDQPFYIADDLKRFKSLTIGHPVIMGRKTFEALPHGALPGRRNIVITRRKDWSAEGAEVANSLEEASCLAGEEAFIIGGGQLYSNALDLADTLYITRVYARVPDADTFFPEYEREWEIVEETPLCSDVKNKVEYQFQILHKK